MNWPPLTNEVDASVSALRTRRKVENAAADWVASGRDREELLGARGLARAVVDIGAHMERLRANDALRGPRRKRLPWPGHRRLVTTRIDLDDMGREFLEASIRAESSRRRRGTAVIVVIAARRPPQLEWTVSGVHAGRSAMS